MDTFKLIYKILAKLDKHKGDETFDYYEISAKALNVSFNEWEQIMIELQRNGYIRGLVYTKAIDQKFEHICEPVQPSITLKGMEYLAENSFMAKAKEFLKIAGDFI